MITVNELQNQAIHGMIGADDFLKFRESLYKTLIYSKYKNLIAGKDDNEELMLTRSECHLVETCLEMFKDFDLGDKMVVEKTFFLLKSLMLHFQVIGIHEAIKQTGRIGLVHDVNYQVFTEENLIDKINVQYTYYKNIKIFETYFARQQKQLSSYCQREFKDCYESISQLCEG